MKQVALWWWHCVEPLHGVTVCRINILRVVQYLMNFYIKGCLWHWGRTSGFIKSTEKREIGGWVERSKPSGHSGWVDGVLHLLSQAELIHSWPFHGFWHWLQYWVPLLCIPTPGWRTISDDQLWMSFQELSSLWAHQHCFLENTISSLWW